MVWFDCVVGSCGVCVLVGLVVCGLSVLGFGCFMAARGLGFGVCLPCYVVHGVGII